jgi:hypothetical protein
VDGVDIPLDVDFTVPKDSDGDRLPDKYENDHVGLAPDKEDSDIDGLTDDLEDADISDVNTYDGDGLTNFEEYRGFMWVANMVADTSSVYKTTAYVPGATVGHFRSDPNIKDLFVRYTGYGGTNPQFAMGAAFLDAGIAVHALDSPAPVNATHGEANIDVLLVTNDLVLTYKGVNGKINKRGQRDWTWDTKGASSKGTADAYADDDGVNPPDGVSDNNTKTYQRSLDGYFYNRTYRDGGEGVPSNNVLDLNSDALVDDNNDDGVNNRKQGQWEAGSEAGALKGDLYIIGDWSVAGGRTTFDMDNDNMVELPVVASVDQILSDFEYTMPQVLKHTITHEMGHAVGMSHNQVDTALMFVDTNNWSRDHLFSDDSKAEIQIINNIQND